MVFLIHISRLLLLPLLCVKGFVIISNENTFIESVEGLPKATGVTSVFVASDDETKPRLYVGTKYGKTFESRDLGSPWTELIHDEATKFPVFSLMLGSRRTTDGQEFLFCGGGDRYVTVWEHRITSVKQDRRELCNWRVVQQLGPHTGWVKHLQYDSTNEVLHSIGCNCIETWRYCDVKQSEASPSTIDLLPMMTHVTKRTIENSPTMGSTLSSDLLCLCLIDEDQTLVSGGVDGRLHLWSSDYTLPDPETSVAVHDGRISVLMYAPIANIIFSAGYDGRLNAFRFHRQKTISKKSPSIMLHKSGSISLEDIDNESRITEGVCIHETNDSIEIALGTSDGLVVLVHADLSSSCGKQADCSFTLRHRGVLELQDRVMIYSLGVETTTSDSGHLKSSIFVGHAAGLTKIELPSSLYS